MFPELFLEMPKRSLAVVLLLVAALACGCGSGGGSSAGVLPADITALFSESGTAAAADGVRLSGSANDDLVDVEVRIGGPTSSTDLYSFAFDLVLGDPSVAEYVDGTATLGQALTAGDGQSLQVLTSQNGDRVTVGVTKVGGGLGNGVTESGETAVCTLTFRVLRTGTATLTIEGAPNDVPAAIDSNGDLIDEISFDQAAATLGGV